MRIRKIRDKDVAAAAALLERVDASVPPDRLAQRLHDFQYKSNHAVMVAERAGRLVALIHIGIEPSLMDVRTASVYFLALDPSCEPGLHEALLTYGRQWARQHGCAFLDYGRERFVLEALEG